MTTHRDASPLPLVSITMVTHNSMKWLAACLDALDTQTYRPIEIVVVDNNSTDGTLQYLRSHRRDVRSHVLDTNVGFAQGQNVAMRQASGEFILVLNPDVVLDPDFITWLAGCAKRNSHAGAFIGKILQMTTTPGDITPPRIDHVGFLPLRSGSTWDRGQGELDSREWSETGEVFGFTGAAVLLRQSALSDTAYEGEFFDESFFFYNEDVDLSWRLQLFGWAVLYEPRAVAWHVRRFPSSAPRRARDPLINLHLAKNRQLVMIKNYPVSVLLRNSGSLTMWVAAMMAYLLLFERESLPAVRLAANLLPTALRWRRHIMTHRRVPDRQLLEWYRETDMLRARSGHPRKGEFFERLRQLFSNTHQGRPD